MRCLIKSFESWKSFANDLSKTTIVKKNYDRIVENLSQTTYYSKSKWIMLRKKNKWSKSMRWREENQQTNDEMRDSVVNKQTKINAESFLQTKKRTFNKHIWRNFWWRKCERFFQSVSQSDDLKTDDVDCWRLLALVDKKSALLKSQIQIVVVLSTCEVRKKNDCCYRSAKIKTTILCERFRQCFQSLNSINKIENQAADIVMYRRRVKNCWWNRQIQLLTTLMSLMNRNLMLLSFWKV